MNAQKPRRAIDRTAAVNMATEAQSQEKWINSVPKEYQEMWASTIGADVVQQKEDLRKFADKSSQRVSTIVGPEVQVVLNSANVTGVPPALPLSRVYKAGNPAQPKSDPTNFERVRYLLNQVKTTSDETTKERAKETLSNMTHVQLSTQLSKLLKSSLEKVEKRSPQTDTPVEISAILSQIEKTKLGDLYEKQVQQDLPKLAEVTWN